MYSDPDIGQAKRAAEELLKERKFQEAADALEALVSRVGANPEVLMLSAKALFMVKQYGAAADRLRAVLALNPRSLAALQNLKLCLSQLGQLTPEGSAALVDSPKPPIRATSSGAQLATPPAKGSTEAPGVQNRGRPQPPSAESFSLKKFDLPTTAEGQEAWVNAAIASDYSEWRRLCHFYPWLSRISLRTAKQIGLAIPLAALLGFSGFVVWRHLEMNSRTDQAETAFAATGESKKKLRDQAEENRAKFRADLDRIKDIKDNRQAVDQSDKHGAHSNASK